MKRKKISSTNSLMMLTLIIVSCQTNYVPKPHDYLRVEYPEKKYQLLDTLLPYSFEYPEYCVIEPSSSTKQEFGWINIHFKTLHAKIHLSYKKIDNNLPSLTNDAYDLVYKHTIKAEAIRDSLVMFPEKKIYGIVFDIEGNTATSLQFFLTDSTKKFVRGALYFNAIPNKDSLAPVLRFCREDVIHLIKTFEWK